MGAQAEIGPQPRGCLSEGILGTSSGHAGISGILRARGRRWAPDHAGACPKKSTQGIVSSFPGWESVTFFLLSFDIRGVSLFF